MLKEKISADKGDTLKEMISVIKTNIFLNQK